MASYKDSLHSSDSSDTEKKYLKRGTCDYPAWDDIERLVKRELEDLGKLPWSERVSMYMAKYAELERRRKELDWLKKKESDRCNAGFWRWHEKVMTGRSPDPSSCDEWQWDQAKQKRSDFIMNRRVRRRRRRKGESAEGDTEEEYKTLLNWDVTTTNVL